MRFKRKTTTFIFDKDTAANGHDDKGLVVTYDSGADGNYISEADRKKSRPPHPPRFHKACRRGQRRRKRR